jgi:Flp pilus assembly protein TadD
MQDRLEQARASTAAGLAAFKEGRLSDAEESARRALEADPARPEAHFLVGLLAVERKDWRTGISAFGSVTRLNPQDGAAWAHLALLLQRVGHFERADEALARALAIPPANADGCDLLGGALAQFGRHREARSWHRKAAELEPERADFAVNLASANIFLGNDAEAAAALDRFIETEGAPQAEWLFSTLRRAQNRSRADRLEARAGAAPSASARAFLHYAAGKEYEDCELWDEAFAAFDAGARAKRSTLHYDEGADAALFDALKTHALADEGRNGRAGLEDPSPIFIIGQPRTGTTLVERIIASHSSVESAGELQQFGLALRRVTRSAAAADWSRADPRAIGEAYLKSVAPMRGGKPRFIDKLPRNFLYAPFIAAALPQAKIIHLMRDPLDACFASFKQLFAEAYPHSYDQREMARHYCRYASLMDHWRTVAPNAFLDVSYEKLIFDLEAEARRVVDYLALPWEDRCLRFHDLDAPVATASAVQVREAVHARSVGRALKYGARLAPMRQILAGEGLISPVVGPDER